MRWLAVLAVGLAVGAAPRYSNGFLVFVDRAADTVKVLDAAGAVHLEAKLRVPGMRRVELLDAAVDTGGEVAVAARGENGGGRYGAGLLIRMRGEAVRVVRLEDFAVEKVAFGVDGRLFALGGGEVREYDGAGGLVRRLGKARGSFLVVNGERVGVVGSSGYLEFGGRRFQWVLPSGVEAAVVTGAGRLFVGAGAGVWEWRGGRWVAVEGKGALVGVSGERLVFWTGAGMAVE